MIEELQLIKEMVGDLTAFGGWAFGGYILYSLVKLALTFGASCWLINKLITLIFDHLKAPVSKEEYERQKDKLSELMSDLSKARRETQEVKHMYKLMKDKAVKDD